MNEDDELMPDDLSEGVTEQIDDFSSDFDMGMDLGRSPLEKHSDLLKELTNFDPIIQTRVRNWMGLAYDAKEEKYIKKRPAIMNLKGTWWCIRVLQVYMSRPNIITNLDKHEIKYLRKDIIQMCWLNFMTKEDFGINGDADWGSIAMELEHSALLVLAGAGDGKYTKFLGDSVTRTESIHVSPQAQQPQQPLERPGLMQRIKGTIMGKR